MDNIDFVEYRNLQLGNLIDGGSFGDVYKAHWRTENKAIVVKKIRRVRDNAGNNEKAILNEIKNNKVLNHPNIITFYVVTKDSENKICMLFEFADCGSLYSFLHESNIKITLDGKLNWMSQIAKGMEYLHDQKKVHRNLKSKNLLLCNNYRTVKICDFGTIKELATVNTEGIGTYTYMAPEICYEGGRYTEMCDVFSFGIVFWEVMSGKKPFYDSQHMLPIALQRKINDEGKRPNIDDIDKLKKFEYLYYTKLLIQKCWDNEPLNRPTMKILATILGIHDINFINYPNLLFEIDRLRNICKEDFKFPN
ncbi:mitogen-activated protein kinase kinase kinase 7-like isoform X2 [Drosophila albomicans]|uniref:Mitogen-activated protein kinase kinase kinase 7-like isoform X2 n=1 Tax=Drosophila albomicans TaxID=7291 RepID=A0A6P8XHJ6_DROAB|nr:mitogen-activated protein kinase kinase kinase 7-like isoform X2 [Drosophila albomicans]